MRHPCEYCEPLRTKLLSPATTGNYSHMGGERDIDIILGYVPCLCSSVGVSMSMRLLPHGGRMDLI